MAMPNMQNEAKPYVGIGFQVIAFITVIGILTLLFYPRFVSFRAYDSRPVFFHWPEKERTSESVLKMGLHIYNFSEFDTIRNSFNLSGILWFDIDPKIMNIADLRKFQMINGDVLEFSEERQIPHGSNILVYFNVRMRFKASLDYSCFPMEDHRIFFGLSNDAIPYTTKFITTEKDITFSPDFYLPGWSVIKRNVEAGYTTINLEVDEEQYSLKQSCVIFSLDCERVDPCDIVTMLLSLMLILLIVVGTFSSSLVEHRLSIISASIIALISYRFVVETLSPPHVRYFMISDYLFLSVVAAIITGLFLVLMVRHHAYSAFVQSLCVIATYTVFIAGCCCALLLS